MATGQDVANVGPELDGRLDGAVAATSELGGRRTQLVGYWIGREFWGRGLATRALAGTPRRGRRAPAARIVGRATSPPIACSRSAVRQVRARGDDGSGAHPWSWGLKTWAGSGARADLGHVEMSPESDGRVIPRSLSACVALNQSLKAARRIGSKRCPGSNPTNDPAVIARRNVTASLYDRRGSRSERGVEQPSTQDTSINSRPRSAASAYSPDA